VSIKLCLQCVPLLLTIHKQIFFIRDELAPDNTLILGACLSNMYCSLEKSRALEARKSYNRAIREQDIAL
jgi:hypothetical protein